MTENLKSELQTRAKTLGFAICQTCDPELIEKEISAAGAGLNEFLASGFHGDMDWLAREPQRRSDPRQLVQDWSENKTADNKQVRSIIMLGVNYAPPHNPLDDIKENNKGAISVYAQRRDYHDVMKKQLRVLARWLAEESDGAVKLFVDTAPLMEKPLAAAAGLGWQGKHTNLVSSEFGSWVFLGAILAETALPPDAPAQNQCGSCRACLDICPTDAFVAPYKLDARKCISYLTIEHKGAIERELRPKIGNRIYGCDDCLAVCPWNKFAQSAKENKFAQAAKENKFAQSANEIELKLQEDLRLPDLLELAKLDDKAFRKRFAKTPIKRTGRDRFLRNVLIAIGNSKSPDKQVLEVLEKCLSDDAPQVRAMAVWAMLQLDKILAQKLKIKFSSQEQDAEVLAEWDFIK